MSKIEHFNITAPEIDEAIKTIQIIAPDFKIIKNAKSSTRYGWAHIGNNEYYFAFREGHIGSESQSPRQAYKNDGVNHNLNYC